jgi:hypothetical protein
MRLLILAGFLLAESLCAQNTMEVVKTSGGSEQISLSSITKITFTATDMVVGGAGRTIPLNTIRVIFFTNVQTAIEEGVASGLLSFQSLSPNPFNPATGLKFGLIQDGKVRIMVYGVSGGKIKNLLNTPLKAGYYEIAWNGTDDDGKPVAAGTYLIRMDINGRSINKKAILLK